MSIDIRPNTIIYYIILSLGLICCQEQPDTSQKGPTLDSEVAIKTSGKLPEVMRTTQNIQRDLWQKPDLVLNKLGDVRNKTIADIGAGSGYFAFRILPKCERIIAIEIDPEAIEYMDSVSLLLPDPFRDHFETRLSDSHDSKLNPGEADIIIMVNTYLYIDDRTAYLNHLESVLPPDGRLLIIDYKKKKIPTGPEASQRVALSVAEAEIEKAGFTIINSDDQSLTYQYIILAGK